ncbi:hypothetical protein ACU81Q_05685 [Komagataeibacter melomenusus]
MSNEEVKKLLIYMIEKYISDPERRTRLIDLTLHRKDPFGRPPVKGIMYDVLSHVNQDISRDDDEIVSKMAYFFG